MCVHRYTTKDCFNNIVQVPCGGCITCLATKRTFMCHRILFDVAFLSRIGIGSSFITFTVNDDYVKGDGSVRKREMQLLHKRFRKAGAKFRYLVIGDYGEKTQRKHYHGIYIGLDTALAKDLCKRFWNVGFCDVEPVLSSNVSYVVRYVYGQTKDYKGMYESQGYEAPFTLCSNGIGEHLFAANYDQIFSEGRYYYRGRYYKAPQYWIAKNGSRARGVDMQALRRDKRLAFRYGFKSVQAYRDWRGRTAEYVATRRYRNTLSPPQGLRHVYSNVRRFRPMKALDIDLFFEE